MHLNIQPGDLRKLCTLRERAGNHGGKNLPCFSGLGGVKPVASKKYWGNNPSVKGK